MVCCRVTQKNSATGYSNIIWCVIHTMHVGVVMSPWITYKTDVFNCAKVSILMDFSKWECVFSHYVCMYCRKEEKKHPHLSQLLIIGESHDRYYSSWIYFILIMKNINLGGHLSIKNAITFKFLTATQNFDFVYRF